MSEDQIIDALGARIAFHRRWKGIWSVSYFVGAAASVITAALATASAGFIGDAGEGKELTAGLALAATILTSLEKVLKLREKWDLHRNSQIALEIIQLKALAGSLDGKGAVEQIERVAQSYSMQLGDMNQGPKTE